MKSRYLAVVILIAVTLPVYADDADPLRALQLLKETPVSKLEYGLDRMQVGIEKRIKGLESHPAGPQRLSVYTRPRRGGLFVGYSALYPRSSEVRCTFVFELIKRKLGIAISKTPLQKRRAVEDLLEQYFLDAVARNLADNVEQVLTVYIGSYSDDKAERCRSNMLSDRIIMLDPE